VWLGYTNENNNNNNEYQNDDILITKINYVRTHQNETYSAGPSSPILSSSWTAKSTPMPVKSSFVAAQYGQYDLEKTTT
jgi:hypothetical protein